MSSYVNAIPEMLAATSADLTNLGSTISEAQAVAAARTTSLMAAGQDEVSAAVAALFGNYAEEYQALSAQAAQFHQGLVQTLSASAGSYATAESANASALLQSARQNVVNAVNSASESLLGRSLIATSTGGSTANSVAVTATPTPISVATTLIMGGTGQQIPSSAYIQAVENLFISPNLTGGTTGLNTPEQFYPINNFKQLTLSASVSQGVEILDQALQPYVSNGESVGVFGYSQSAVIASLEMSALKAQGVPTSDVSFVLIGDLMNPNGGIFERYAGLNLSALGIDFYGATPSNDYPTTIYTMEYDFWADSPKYPLDILTDLNAFASSTHFDYTSLTTTQISQAIPLTTSSADTMTKYYMIPVNNLPLLDGLRNIPIIGNPVADLLQPDLTYLVNLGYGDPNYGWSTSYADVPTQIGLLPPLKSFEELPSLLVSGAQQGVQDFVGDFTGSGPNPVTLPTLSSLTSSLLNSSSGTGSVTSALTSLSQLSLTPTSIGTGITNIANTVSASLSNVSGALSATGDVINGAVISIPSYDVNLFLDGIQQAFDGQPLTGIANAVGRPIAADIVLYLLLGELESDIISNL